MKARTIYEQMKVSTTPAPVLTCPIAVVTEVPGSIRVSGVPFSLCQPSLCGPVLGTKGGGRGAGVGRSSQGLLSLVTLFGLLQASGLGLA